MNAQNVCSSVIRQILIEVQQNIHCYSKISIQIYHKEILDFILNLQFEQILKNTSTQNCRLLRRCTILSLRISSYIYRCRNQIEITIKTIYIATIFNWIFERLITDLTIEHFLNEYSLTLIRDQ